jgi:hypothetical protein
VAEGAGAAVLDAAGAVVGAGVIGAGSRSTAGEEPAACFYPLVARVTTRAVDLAVQISELAPCALGGLPPDAYVCVVPAPARR